MWFITENIWNTKVCEKWLHISFKLKKTQGDPGDPSHILQMLSSVGYKGGRFTVCPEGKRLITPFLAYIIRNRWTILFNYYIA